MYIVARVRGKRFRSRLERFDGFKSWKAEPLVEIRIWPIIIPHNGHSSIHPSIQPSIHHQRQQKQEISRLCYDSLLIDWHFRHIIMYRMQEPLPLPLPTLHPSSFSLPFLFLWRGSKLKAEGNSVRVVTAMNFHLFCYQRYSLSSRKKCGSWNACRVIFSILILHQLKKCSSLSEGCFTILPLYHSEIFFFFYVIITRTANYCRYHFALAFIHRRIIRSAEGHERDWNPNFIIPTPPFVCWRKNEKSRPFLCIKRSRDLSNRHCPLDTPLRIVRRYIIISRWRILSWCI